MNKEDLIKKLENIELPEIEIQSHQRRLRLALLNSGYWKEKTFMSLLKKFAPIGAVAVIALLVVVGVNYFKSPSLVSRNSLLVAPEVYAKELVGKAEEQLTKVKAMAGYVEPSTNYVVWKEPDADGNIRDEKGNIIFITDQEGKLVPAPREVPAVAYTFTAESFLSYLEEAKQAKDLTYLGDKRVGDPSHPLSAVGRTIKVLQFTDSKGNTTILGIDENNLPVVRLSFNKTVGGGVIFQPADRGSAPSGEAPGVNYGKISDGTPQPDFEQQIKYWTENLEQPTDFKTIQK
jgi:hypothetical protein